MRLNGLETVHNYVIVREGGRGSSIVEFNDGNSKIDDANGGLGVNVITIKRGVGSFQ